MTQTFTKKHVLLYLYNELDESLYAPFIEELSVNQKLMRFYTDTKEVMGMLEAEPLPGPSATTLQIILEESAAKLPANA